MYKFLSTPELVTVSGLGGDNSITLNKGNPYFETIKGLLETNQEWGEEISKALSNTRSEKVNASNSGFTSINGKMYYEGRVLSPTFSNVVTQYLDEDIPVSPLANLVNGLAGTEEEYALEVMELVSNGVLPITYTGQLIGYKRQSWSNRGFEEISSYEEYRREVFNRVHTPGQYVEYGPGLTVGSLQWAGQFCPDQGCLQEVVVEPGNIIGIKSLTQDKPFLVKSYMFLSNISEREKTKTAEETGKLVFIMQTNTLGNEGNIIVRKPYSPETIREYFNTLISRTPSSSNVFIGDNIEAEFEGVSACL